MEKQRQLASLEILASLLPLLCQGSNGSVAPPIRPATSLKWTQCASLPLKLWYCQAVLLGNTLYVGGGTESCAKGGFTIFVCEFAVDKWSTFPTPVQLYALTTYRSQLVLAGGDLPDYNLTNNLWVMGEGRRTWNQTVPPMPTPRYGAAAISTNNYLIVAGGSIGFKYVDVVEVFDGQQWTQTDLLPKKCRYIKSTCYNDFWYMMGGDGQGQSVFYTSLQSLVDKASHSSPSAHSTSDQSVWKTLPDVPYGSSATTIFGGALLAIGGFDAGGRIYSKSIHMYSPHTGTWEKVGELPESLTLPYSITLSTGEIVVIEGECGLPFPDLPRVYKSTPPPGY